MTPQPSEQPRTAAGRAMLRQDYRGNESYPVTRADILAIEAEMYDHASNEGYHAGIADCKEHDPAHRAAAPDLVANPPEAVRLARRALRRLVELGVDDTNEPLDAWKAAWAALEGAVATPAPLDDLDDLENFAGSGYCPGCKVAIDLHPWRVDDPDAIRCPTPREALDALYARLEGQPVAEEPA